MKRPDTSQVYHRVLLMDLHQQLHQPDSCLIVCGRCYQVSPFRADEFVRCKCAMDVGSVGVLFIACDIFVTSVVIVKFY